MASVAYNKNTDYTKLLKDALAAGQDTTTIAAARDAKIADNPTLYGNLESSQSYIDNNKPMNIIKPTGPVGGTMGNSNTGYGYNPNIAPPTGTTWGTPNSDGTLPTINTPIDYNTIVNGIYQPRMQADLTNIRTAYDNYINSTNAQKPLQDQYRASALNTNDANYYQGQQGLNASMEAAGQRGGENITGNIALQATRGNGVNQANQTYTNNISAIDEAVRQAQGQQASELSQATNKWQSAMAEAVQKAQQQGFDNSATVAGLTGNFIDPTTGNSTSTLAANQYKAAQEQQAWQNKFNEGQAATEQSNYLAHQAYQATRDQINDEHWLAQFTATQKQQILDNALAQKKISQDDYANATSRLNANNNHSESTANLDYQKQKDKLEAANVAKGLNANGSKPTTTTKSEQDNADNAALAEASSQTKAKTFEKWFEDNQTTLANDLSTSAFNKLYTQYVESL